MRLLWLVPIAFLAAAVAARPALASGCLRGPFAMPAFAPPADCTIVYYTLDTLEEPPRAHVYRNNQQVDVTGTSLQVQDQQLDFAVYTVDCDGSVVSETHSREPYAVYNVTLANVQPGEDVWVGSQLLGSVQPAGGACNNSELPQPYCSGMYDWESCNPPSDDDPPQDDADVEDGVSGCSAGGGTAGIAVVLLALAFVRRRRGAALLVLAPIAMLAVPRDALASPACSGPWIPTYRSPPGCPLIAVSRDPLPPTVEVWRNGELVADAVATIVTTNIQLDVSYSGPTCAGDWEVQEVRSEPFVQHSIEVSNTQPGDEVLLDQFFGAALIEQPGPCYAVSLPRPECYASQMATPCPDDDDDDIDLDAGCNASGGSAHWLVVLLALAFVRRRR